MNSSEGSPPGQLVAAVVGAPRGLQGEVSLLLRTDLADERFAEGQQLSTQNPAFPVLTVAKLSYYRGRAYARFVEVGTREEAEELRGTEVLVTPVLEEDAWYPHELVGILVEDSAGQVLGTVEGLLTGLAQDLLEVDSGGQTVLVPLVSELVPVIDIAARRIVVTPPAGLFPETEE